MKRPRAVTFDCWSTLIYEPEPGRNYARRVELLAECAESLGLGSNLSEARLALDQGWQRHVTLWQQEVASGARDIAGWALDALIEQKGGEVPEGGTVDELGERMSGVGLEASNVVSSLEGARDTLAALAGAGVRRALICDTGFSPASVVRQMLDGQGLLEYLEVTIFSDEAGVPKPNARVFERALHELDLSARPAEAVHVGDLRRTDVAGARSAGMGTVRIADHHDDSLDLPDADHVAESHQHLREILGLE